MVKSMIYCSHPISGSLVILFKIGEIQFIIFLKFIISLFFNLSKVITQSLFSKIPCISFFEILLYLRKCLLDKFLSTCFDISDCIIIHLLNALSPIVIHIELFSILFLDYNEFVYLSIQNKVTIKERSTILKLSLIHISEPTRLGMISYAVFCLKKKK